MIEVFNKKLEEKLRKQEIDIEILTRQKIALETMNKERGITLNENRYRIQFLEEQNKDVNSLRDFKRIAEIGGRFLNTWFTYTILPQSCDSKLELTYAGFNLKFSPNNFNHEKFPEMTLYVFQGDYNLECKVEMNAIENKLLNDIFAHLLKNHKKLGQYAYVWDKRIDMFNKSYSFPETQTFIEDIVKVYREAFSQYWKIIKQSEKDKEKA